MQIVNQSWEENRGKYSSYKFLKLNPTDRVKNQIETNL